MEKSSTLSRSDQIRQRRSSSSVRRKNTIPRSTRGRKSSSRSTGRGMPPVLVRGDVPLDSMASPKRRSRTRRRYDIALSMPGAELRLPSLPAVRFGWRAVSFSLVALLIMALYVMWNSPIYLVEEIHVEGLQRLAAGEISTLLDLRGEHIFTLNAQQLYTDIQETFPEFASINVEVGLPNKVDITVTERIPVMVWYENGRTLWVDEDGYAFPAREDIDAPDLVINAAGAPRVNVGEDADPHQLLTPEFVAAIQEVREIAPEGRQLLYSMEHGLGWKEKKGWEVYLGQDLTNVDMKLNVYEAIAKHLKKANLKPALVSVEMVHAPYYRMEQ